MKAIVFKFLFVIGLLTIQNSVFGQQIQEQKQYEVTGAGMSQVNGIYHPDGKEKGVTCYRKGEFRLVYVGCHSKWMIQSPNGNLYRNKIDSKFPPKEAWEKGCGEGSKDPAPKIIPVNNENQNIQPNN